jgi:hypothetical protein
LRFVFVIVVIGSQHDNLTSFNGSKLIEMGEENSLFILNTMFVTGSDEHRWSFHSNLGYKRRLDYIMAEWFVKHANTNCRSYPMQSHPFESDHRIVVMDTLFPTRKTIKKTFHKTRRDKKHPDLRRLRDDPSIQGSYSGTLDSLWLPMQELQMSDEAEELLTNVIHQASTGTIPPRTRN